MPNKARSTSSINFAGETNKAKINLVAGAVTLPFAEMVWILSGGDLETINRITSILVSMNTPQEQSRLFEVIHALHGLFGLKLPSEVIQIAASPKALNYFLFSFTCDFGEIMNERLTEAAIEKQSQKT